MVTLVNMKKDKRISMVLEFQMWVIGKWEHWLKSGTLGGKFGAC